MPVLPFDDHQPDVDPSAWIAPGAFVIGEATLHARSSVFYGAVVRADMASVTLGEGSNLQDNVVVHTDTGFPTTIGAHVSVGHSAVVHGCTVEDNCLIGMSATVLNGAVIGEGSLVAAGTVVLEGTVVPPGSLIAAGSVVLEGTHIPPRSLVAGVPGKIRRQLDDDEYAKVVLNARIYLELAAGHRAAVSPDDRKDPRG